MLQQVKLPHLPSQDERPVRVLFVCLGNICRSPAAEGVLRALVEQHATESQWEIDSAGTGDYHIGDLPDRRMRVHARNRGIELNHLCRQVRESDFDYFDLIIPMDHSNMRNLHRMAPTTESDTKIVPMSAFLSTGARYDHIPDPYYEGSEGFELVLDLLDEAVGNLYCAVTNVRQS